MATATSVGRARDEARRQADRPWFTRLARAGIATRGVVYAVIGALALALALGEGGKATDNKGALATIAGAPGGRAVLVLLAAGLLGYTAWRVAQAVLDTDDKGDDAGGLAARAGKLASAVAYGALLVVCISLIAGAGGGGGGGGERSATAGVLGWPGGRLLVGAVGLGIIAYGGWNVWRGLSAGFMKRLRVREPAAEAPLRLAGRIGHVARGVVFALVGVFLVKAAVEFDPGEAVGTDGALARLADQPYGTVLLGLVAAGLVAFAAFCFGEARYREV